MRRKYIGLFIFFVGIVVVYQSNAIPALNVKPIADYLIKNTYSKTGSENVVTAVTCFIDIMIHFLKH